MAVLTESFWPAREGTSLRPTTLPSVLEDAAARAPDTLALVAERDGTPAGSRWTSARSCSMLRSARHPSFSTTCNQAIGWRFWLPTRRHG